MTQAVVAALATMCGPDHAVPASLGWPLGTTRSHAIVAWNAAVLIDGEPMLVCIVLLRGVDVCRGVRACAPRQATACRHERASAMQLHAGGGCDRPLAKPLRRMLAQLECGRTLERSSAPLYQCDCDALPRLQPPRPSPIAHARQPISLCADGMPKAGIQRRVFAPHSVGGWAETVQTARRERSIGAVPRLAMRRRHQLGHPSAGTQLGCACVGHPRGLQCR